MCNKIPNFFILGAPKCGTSAMRSYLSQHPEIFFSVPDEPGYFDRKFRYPDDSQCAYKDLDDYLSLYQLAELGVHKVLAEGSVYMLYDQDIIRSILDISPNAKFLIMLRNPIDGVISMHGENLKSISLGREPCVNLEDAWRDLPNREVSELAGVHPMRFKYHVLYDYKKHVEAAMALIQEDRLKIVVYDDFLKNNLMVFRSICEFLGVSTRFEPDVKLVNERSQAADNVIARLVAGSAKIARRVRWLRFLRGRGYTLNRLTQRPLEKPVLTDDFYFLLRDYFLTDLNKLENMLGVDLTPWYHGENPYR